MELQKIYFFILVQKTVLTEQRLLFSKAMDNSNIRNLYNLSLLGCKRECGARPSCYSINYFRAAKRCELNKMADASAGAGASEKRGCVYSEKADWLDKEFKACPCASGQRCSNGTERCIVEECNRPPIQNIANIQSIGAKTEHSVHCVEDIEGLHLFGRGLTPTTVTARLTCTTDGSWRVKTPSGGRCLVIAFVMVPGTEKDPFLEWKQGNSSKSKPTWDQHYRSGIIDAWDYLSISNVRLSIFKHQQEVKYVVFNGTGSTSLDWLAQSRVTESSWHDLSYAEHNYFGIFGVVDNTVIRRFHMSRFFNGCPGDVGWFSATVKGYCDWELASSGAYPIFVYSNSEQASEFETKSEKADFVYILLNIDT